MTSFETIYNRFAQKITDFKLLELSDTDVEELLYGYLNSSIAKFKKCKSDLSQRDGNLRIFLIDLLDIEIEILAIMMVSEWLEPQLNSVLYTSQFFGSVETKFYAQANQLEKLMVLKENNELKARKLIRNYSYQTHEYIND